MRHITARACLFWVLIGLGAPPAGAADGEQLFKAKCQGCHSQKKVLDGVSKIPEAQRATHFDKWLVSHHLPDDVQRKAITDYPLKTVAK
jgi:mono/diheme cytochrome c family protein